MRIRVSRAIIGAMRPYVWKMRRTAATGLRYVKKINEKRRRLLFYSQFIKEGDLCFDVGANLGNRTEIFVELGAYVVAIEPQDVCMEELRTKYRDNERVTLVQKSVGDREGEGEIVLSSAHTLASMSREWIRSVKASGRFPDHKWDKVVRVEVTTLDRLIEQYGKPVFCKIDVEGFELQALKGLSHPIETISFEFVPEFISSTIDCIRHLCTIGRVHFNYSVGESMHLALPELVGQEEICKLLLSLPDRRIFGDIYAQFSE